MKVEIFLDDDKTPSEEAVMNQMSESSVKGEYGQRSGSENSGRGSSASDGDRGCRTGLAVCWWDLQKEQALLERCRVTEGRNLLSIHLA